VSGHWTVGVGQVGCLYNHTESLEDLNDLLANVVDLYELTTDQKNTLRHDKIVYFDGEQREMNGDYIELSYSDEPLEEDES
jgi:hypothetical protein